MTNTLPNEVYESTQVPRGYRVCRGCDKLRLASAAGWYHRRYNDVDYFACSKECWEVTLRRYPDLLEAMKAGMRSEIEYRKQEVLNAQSFVEAVEGRLAQLEQIERNVK